MTVPIEQIGVTETSGLSIQGGNLPGIVILDGDGGGGGGISEITSEDGSVSVTNGSGPTADLSLANVTSTGGISIIDTSEYGIIFQSEPSGSYIVIGSDGSIIIQAGADLAIYSAGGGIDNIILPNLPGTDPHNIGQLYVGAGGAIFQSAG